MSINGEEDEVCTEEVDSAICEHRAIDDRRFSSAASQVSEWKLQICDKGCNFLNRIVQEQRSEGELIFPVCLCRQHSLFGCNQTSIHGELIFPVSIFNCLKVNMAERQLPDQQLQSDPQLLSPLPPREDMIACVSLMETALLPCLPARELQAIDRSPHPSHQIDVERHARDFMEAAKKLQLYFISLQRQDQPTKAQTLRKEITLMEEELKKKNDIINKHEKLIKGWKKDLKEQLDRHRAELEKV